PRAVDAAALARARREAREAGSGWRILGDVGIGVGIVAMIGSSVPAVMAYGKARNLESKLNPDPDDPSKVRIFNDPLQSDYRSGPGLEKLFIGLAVTGGVIVVAGAIALWYGKRVQRKATEKLYLTPGATGADLAWRF
ncbi:MAG: hypothetical protein HY906_21220, partial [Deltaproteobacteria bacterium]|nr:hypothetical protein [Deltaproteobacteria bacterium]